jgi:hypothetical protein
MEKTLNVDVEKYTAIRTEADDIFNYVVCEHWTSDWSSPDSISRWGPANKMT